MDKGGFDLLADLREDTAREAQAKADAARRDYENDVERVRLWWGTYNAVISSAYLAEWNPAFRAEGIEQRHWLAVDAAKRAHGWVPSVIDQPTEEQVSWTPAWKTGS